MSGVNKREPAVSRLELALMLLLSVLAVVMGFESKDARVPLLLLGVCTITLGNLVHTLSSRVQELENRLVEGRKTEETLDIPNGPFP